ncbi:MAG: hypothetical protein COY69_01475 [Candidatus Magasanikbacteria bacterium CG_4_10_14_0_8_um_filter_32_14]|uniref:Uncharacterized protein n=2 Tax=Candidatus Magasanikiibacteriota TaxID=1752731 RepID=A0A2M7R9P2_9BACT|nr:MAG: hypothetical protein AUJ23_00770 [Candidatus Magasanikbacteria bacterium CG1_02_32_51]PIY93460.1 MAG: hypothetical protein COY69_01475 [Candidatus Magasanikbacteria bacterium CG_4_10_14_0_8_um_filter_32_14]
MFFNKKAKTKKVFYIFEGWVDEKKRLEFHGSVDFLEQEAAAKRIVPNTPEGLILVWGKSGEIENVGTPAGSRLKVIYLPYYTNTEEIEKFFADLGLKVRPE